MRSWRAFVSALILFQMTGPASFAIVAVPPEIVGPPSSYMTNGDCPTQFARPGGTTMGAAIPVPALRLGSSVQRAKESFGTGGGGTSNASELSRRRSLGLPTAPKTFDVAGSALPRSMLPMRLSRHQASIPISGCPEDGIERLLAERADLCAADFPNDRAYRFAGAYAFKAARGQGKAPDHTCPKNEWRCLPATTGHRRLRLRHVGRPASQAVLTIGVQLAPARCVQARRVAAWAGPVRPADTQWRRL